jgi:hypothetical protein
MKTARCLAAAMFVATAPWLGCAKEQTAPPPQPIASEPTAAPSTDMVGLTELQAPPAPSSSLTATTPDETWLAPDAIVAVRSDGTRVTAAQVARATQKIDAPPGASLTASAEVSEVRAFPEEEVQTTVAVDGVARSYETSQPYLETVRFFDHSFATGGFQVSERAATKGTTVWAIRCPGGERAHVAVRNTNPTTMELVEASRVAPRPPARTAPPGTTSRAIPAVSTARLPP